MAYSYCKEYKKAKMAFQNATIFDPTYSKAFEALDNTGLAMKRQEAAEKEMLMSRKPPLIPTDQSGKDENDPDKKHPALPVRAETPTKVMFPDDVTAYFERGKTFFREKISFSPPGISKSRKYRARE